MTKHPYEMGGILFTVAILAGILCGFALDNSMPENTSASSSSSFEEYYKDIKENHPSYYDDVYKMQGDCKKNAYDLQDFYDCVNKP